MLEKDVEILVNYQARLLALLEKDLEILVNNQIRLLALLENMRRFWLIIMLDS